MYRRSLFSLLPIAVGFGIIGLLPAIPCLGVENSPQEIPLTRKILQVGHKLVSHSLAMIPGSVSASAQGGLINVCVHKFSLFDDISLSEEQVESAMEPIGGGGIGDKIRVIADTLKGQTGILQKRNEMFATKFQFDTEFVTRKQRYTFPNDDLIVVIADFSSGDMYEGREIADEIANNLRELVRETKIPINLLHGEIKPGMTIRSEYMARDVGRSLPPGAEYVVIWGTMSPRTVGRYRAYLTSVSKTSEPTGDKGEPEEFGTDVSFQLALECQELPLAEDPEERARESYRRLIGVTCAAVPQLYTAHALNRERKPDLEGYFEYIGEQESQDLRREVEALMPWIDAKEDWAAAHGRTAHEVEGLLRRLSSINKQNPYPKFILNARDSSCLALIVDEDGDPKEFGPREFGPDEDKKNCKYIAYIDILEVSNQQFIEFLNSQDQLGGQKRNQEKYGVLWLDLPSSSITVYDEQGFAPKPKLNGCPLHSVSWYVDSDYCTWANKELPSDDEWFAAKTDDGPKVEDTESKCGDNENDKSRIGCYDMHGNVSEWGYARAGNDPDGDERRVFGDNYKKNFAIERLKQPRAKHSKLVGFRGVIRFPVE